MSGRNSTVDGHVLVDGDILRFAASDGYLYTYGEETGLIIDRQRIGIPSFVSPVLFSGSVAADRLGNLTVFPVR